MSDFESRRREIIKHGEGSIPHMYLYTVGKVTVAVGNMLPDAAAGQTLVFVKRGTDQRASVEESSADFAAVSAQPKGKVAGFYKQFTKLDMPEQAINELLDARIVGFEAGLRKDFVGYDGFPDSARIGLMDMAFNLGNRGLVKKFPTFTAAARASDWAKCAEECKRQGIADSRNEETEKLFLGAAAEA